MSDNNKKPEHNDQDSGDWKDRFNDLVQTCQTELKKTTKIGIKMLSATQSNSQLHESYEELGKWLVEEVSAKRIKVDDVRIEGLISKISDLKNQLSEFEDDVQEIKKS
jgi:hypothetical protein